MIGVSKQLKGLSTLHLFMANDMFLRDFVGPLKGDTLTYQNKDWLIYSSHMSSSPTDMLDYSIVAHSDNNKLELRVPVEDLTSNGWSWHVGKFSYDLELQEIPGLFHVVDPVYQNTFDIFTIDEGSAAAKAQESFKSDSSHFIVHRMYSLKPIPSAKKIVSQLQRAIKSIPLGFGPLSDTANHPESFKSIKKGKQSVSKLIVLQSKIEEAFQDYYGTQTCFTLGQGIAYSTNDFQILEQSAVIDGNLQISD